MIQTSRPSLLDRFRSLLAEREEELGVSDDYGVSGLSTEGIVQIFEIVLSDLTTNSKPAIGELTMIAGEHRDHSEGISDAICARIFQVPAEHKLSSLYLLDSIVKNIGGEYVSYFASRLPEMFCETFRQVHPKFCPSMRHLFRTWSTIFPPSVLRKIESELQFSAPISQQSSDVNAFRSSGSPRPAHGIHVNPKYLEARRQFEHSGIESRRETDPSDVNPHRTAFGRKRKGRDASASPKRRSGASLTSHTSKNERNFLSSLQHHGRNPVTANDQYDADHPGFVTSSVRSQKLPPPGNSGRVSNIGRAEDLDFPKTKLKSLPISPSRIWPARSPPSDNEFTREKSPARASGLHSKFTYKHRKSSPLDGNRDNFVAEYKPDDSHQLLESSWSYSLNNGYNQQSPRALIDAYGNDRGKKTLNEESLKVDINSNRVTNKAVTKSWQNDDEDEYMWEDMSPTLTNQKSNDFISSNFLPASLSTRASLAMPSVSISKPNFRRGSWDSHAPFSMVDDAATSTKEGISILGPGVGSLSGHGCQYAPSQRQGSHYSQESWKTQQHLPQLTSAHMSFSTNQMSPAEQDMSSSIDKRLNTEAYFQRPLNTVLRMDTSDSTTPPLASTVNNLKRRHQSPSKASSTFPPANGSVSHPRSLLPSFSQQNQIKDHNVLMDLHNPLTCQSQLADQQAGSISLNQQRQKQAAPLWPQGLRPRNAHENFSSSFPAETYSLITQQPWNHRHNPNIHGSTTRSDISSQNSGLVSSSANNDRRSNTAFHVNQYNIHPLPVGIPNPSQMGTTFQNMGLAASLHPDSNVFSGLINSLVAQGLISAAPSASVQDSVEVEFNTDLSKIRYKSAINALYCDLPRKCTTCGLRFKCQEKHSSHMDWHVTKNRVSKNYKQKPSRKWFVSTNVWLSGAEAVGSDAIPKFWSNEVNLEEKVEKEIAVLADENQDACALCGEPFDNFYSDEIEEWMYRGAVYLNAPNGSTSMDRSQLGPIIHAKCRSASEVITLEDFGLEK